MKRRLEKTHDNVIGYSLAGEVTDSEYEQLLSELRDEVAKHGKIRLLFRLQDLSAKSFFSALDERFQFFSDHRDDVERVAIVSDESGMGFLSSVGDSMLPGETDHFSGGDESEAWAWLE